MYPVSVPSHSVEETEPIRATGYEYDLLHHDPIEGQSAGEDQLPHRSGAEILSQELHHCANTGCDPVVAGRVSTPAAALPGKIKCGSSYS